MKRVSVLVQNDYLERMSKTRPINAVAELVWNSLDADADKIKVKLFENEMGGLRIHANHANDTVRECSEAAIQESLCTCEVCGQAGRLREDCRIKTLCDEHASGHGRRDG